MKFLRKKNAEKKVEIAPPPDGDDRPESIATSPSSLDALVPEIWAKNRFFRFFAHIFVPIGPTSLRDTPLDGQRRGAHFHI